MTTLSEATRAKRGTKRVCQSCEVRFYDLARSPIVCPACQAVFTPVEQPVFQARAPSGKSGWRPTSKRAAPMVPAPDLEPADAAEAEVAEDAIEETTDTASEDAVILEQEDDDSDVTGFIDHDVETPKEP